MTYTTPNHGLHITTMDFEPLLHNPTERSEENAYGTFTSLNVDIIPYDFAGLDRFYERHGYVTNGDLNLHRPTKDVERLVVSWLHCGLLSELLGRLITSTYPRSNRRLEHLLKEYAEKARGLSREARAGFMDMSDDLLICASAWCERFEGSEQGLSLEVAAALLEARIIISSFATALFKIYESWEDSRASLIPHALRAFPKTMSFDPQQPSFARQERDVDDYVSHPNKRQPDRLSHGYRWYHDTYARVTNPRPAPDAQGFTSTANILVARMLENHWCPHQINQVLGSKDYVICDYLSRIKRPTDRSHQGCTAALKCIADNAPSRERYTTKHTSEGCNCEHVLSPMQRIIKIIERGKIPLISLQESEGGGLTFSVCERTASTRYIAMSHVWADGFGNPSANSLPNCTLRQLKLWLENLPLPTYEVGYTFAGKRFDASRLHFITTTSWFWMDTLCIPVEERHRHLRNAHINDMASVYAGASQVLTLDTELLATKASTSATEILARIAFCTWSRRSWTFQEGALGPGTVFQLKDVAVDVANQWCSTGPRHPHFASSVQFPDVDDHINQHILRQLYQRSRSIMQRTYSSARSKKHDDEGPPFPNPARRFGNVGLISRSVKGKELRHPGELFVRCWNELANRTTTMAEDIHIIMANLLDFDAGAVMSLPRAQRMIAMMRSIQHLPLSLLFVSTVELENNDGFHCTWLPKDPNGELLLDHYMTPVTRGLSTPAHSQHFASILLPAETIDDSTLYHPQLRLLLNIDHLPLQNNRNRDWARYRRLLILPTSHLARLTWSDKSVHFEGAIFIISGYSSREAEKEVKDTVYEHSQHQLQLSFRGRVHVKAMAIESNDDTRPRHLPKLQRNNTLHQWPPTEVESIPTAVTLLIVCGKLTS
ncbi:hypothetical protein CC80DRAFT_97815 [Byssothecium circinans]|uniref:Heterokaryon incompatibility domain-containing protein n=1 Tax=Byssothecium circinans TaxID=147558 RepID=A0A6A5UD15_9PLEO|nr:hypothetical protein CC80DRAFT_97815 [Byssothecium circinans]